MAPSDCFIVVSVIQLKVINVLFGMSDPDYASATQPAQSVSIGLSCYFEIFIATYTCRLAVLEKTASHWWSVFEMDNCLK